MERQEIRTFLVEALKRATQNQIDVTKIKDTSELRTDLDVDSLSLMETVWEIEEKLDIHIDEQQLMKLKTVEDCIVTIEALLKAKG